MPRSASVPALAFEVAVLGATTAGEIDQVFTTLVERRASAIVVGGDPFFADALIAIKAFCSRREVLARDP
jgi:hypothetical protein